LNHFFFPLMQLGMYPNSVASLSFNQGGQLLAVASSRTYQEATEMLVSSHPFIFFPFVPIYELACEVNTCTT